MKFYVNCANDDHFQRIQYVFAFIENHPLADGKVSFVFEQTGDTVDITYGQHNNASILSKLFIPKSKIIFGKSPASVSELIPNRYVHESFTLYSVEKVADNQIKPFYSNGQFGFDIVESIFFHISRLEEWFSDIDQLDMHGRMFSKYQFLIKNGLEKTPVVDYLVYCFIKVLTEGRGWENTSMNTNIRLSYDVDILERYARHPPLRSLAKYLLKTPNRSAVSTVLRSYFSTILNRSKDPYLTFNWLLNNGFKGEQVIYFLVGGGSRFDKPTPRLNEKYKMLMEFAVANGVEIGLHPSYLTYDSFERMQQEKDKLETFSGLKIKKSRQHFLHFNLAKTPKILEKANMLEDSSLGYSDKIGFRCGTGFPYCLYDFEAEKPHQLIETPMIAMDVGLVREALELKIDPKELNDDFLNKNRHFTYLTYNFHNSRFFDSALDGIDLRGIYYDLIAR